MSTKTVRMDPEDEKLLARIRKRTGWTTSDALKQGLRALDKQLVDQPPKSAWEIYESLDLGPGGYAAGPATEVRKTVRQILERKRARGTL